MSDAVMRIGSDYDNARIDGFLNYWKESGPQDILELGTLRWESSRPTHHKEWAPDRNWTFSDVEAGVDVDVVADAHDLEPFDGGVFDAVVAVSVWEHLERPWVAARQIERVLKPGGSVYIATHQTFPIHGYPNDFFRFSDKALRLIFEDTGLEVMDCGYAYACQIVPPPVVTRWNPSAPAHLNVDMWAVKH